MSDNPGAAGETVQGERQSHFGHYCRPHNSSGMVRQRAPALSVSCASLHVDSFRYYRHSGLAEILHIVLLCRTIKGTTREAETMQQHQLV